MKHSDNKLSLRDMRIIYLTFLILTVYVLCYFSIRPLLIKNRQLETLLTAACLKCEEVKAKTEALPALKRSLKKAESRYQEAAKRYYPPLENHEIDALITNIAIECGVKISSLSIGNRGSDTVLPFYTYYESEDREENEYSGISAVFISLTATGGSADLNRFIDHICSLKAIQISSFNRSLSDKNVGSDDIASACSLNISLEIYMRKPPL